MISSAAMIVGIDPGKTCGLAVLVGGNLAMTDEIRGQRLARIAGIVTGLATHKPSGVVVVIENQFAKLHGRGRLNIKALGTLFRRRHEWELMCELHGIPTHAVYPATWQTQLRMATAYHADGTKRTTKERAIQVCGQLWPEAGSWTDNTADAALIARWYWQQQIG